MKKMYRVRHNLYGDDLIQEIDVVKETEKTVVVKGVRGWRDQRELKINEYSSVYSTWEEAFNKLKSAAESKVSQAKTKLQSAQEMLSKVKSLKQTLEPPNENE